jgi:hypothetical protein
MSIDNLYTLIFSIATIVYFAILLYQFSWSTPWDYAKNQDFFGLKWKYAIWLIPLPFCVFSALVVVVVFSLFL